MQSYHCTEDGDCDDFALYGSCSHNDVVDEHEHDIINYGKPGIQVYYIHKYEVEQCYGGPEEGGWWYTAGYPCEDWVPFKVVVVDGNKNDNDVVFDYCRMLNGNEHKRREGLQYGYTSVLSYREDFYTYDISTSAVPKAFPSKRPHYE